MTAPRTAPPRDHCRCTRRRGRGQSATRRRPASLFVLGLTLVVIGRRGGYTILAAEPLAEIHQTATFGAQRKSRVLLARRGFAATDRTFHGRHSFRSRP